MAAVETYDAVVFGSGEAGKSIAWYLGATGKRVVVVEQRYVGGSCPNIACLPSKNFVHSASIAHTLATSYHAIEELVIAHPTYAEGLVSLFSNI